MSYSYSYTETATFTVTHARHIAAKVATDLKRLQRLYGRPTDTSIANYEAEIVELLKGGYLGTVAYGYRRSGVWIEPTLHYTASELAGLGAADDDPGRVRPGANVVGATFYSYLTYSPEWSRLGSAEKEVVRSRLPFRRGDAPAPGVAGYFTDDRTYSAGGRALARSSVRSY